MEAENVVSKKQTENERYFNDVFFFFFVITVTISWIATSCQLFVSGKAIFFSLAYRGYQTIDGGYFDHLYITDYKTASYGFQIAYIYEVSWCICWKFEIGTNF